MAINTFNNRLTPEDKKELERWDKLLRNENKAFANANRRNRYHNLGSLDENISLDGRETDRYEVTKGNSPSGEEAYLTNELFDSVLNFIKSLTEEDQIIMINKLADKPMSSTKLATMTGLSDKTVTARFKKHQKTLQQLVKDYS
ncbi:sigma-70 family RNA polymerase sigma factor [Streptococcus sp. HF-100]|uniref:sigma-70 family RNA polymerase sigma factor n=1 Tax=Streptococcus sp. HF-100 TaxID=2785791 RepID=UPI00189C5E09|nr:sigma-70 family RNA polymerase sigma factor [Streptococcus sp. HF-100]MBF7076253.1 sigma-70 family RNA polymerase sigma factor [Streptococcus sp. HF-100]